MEFFAYSPENDGAFTLKNSADLRFDGSDLRCSFSPRSRMRWTEAVRRNVSISFSRSKRLSKEIRESGAQSCSHLEGRFIKDGNEGAGIRDLVSSDITSWLAKSLGMFGHFISHFLSIRSSCRTVLISETKCRVSSNDYPAVYCEQFSLVSIDGQGEFILLSLPKSHGGVEVQIRFTSHRKSTHFSSRISAGKTRSPMGTVFSSNSSTIEDSSRS
jgi:hypothetical protein